MPWRVKFADDIKAARLRAGMSQQALADRLSVTRVQLGNYESGKSAPPLNIAIEIARALDEEFIVEGYKITKHDASPGPKLAPPQQLSFTFGREHRFGSASVTITKTQTDGGVVISAVFENPRTA